MGSRSFLERRLGLIYFGIIGELQEQTLGALLIFNCDDTDKSINLKNTPVSQLIMQNVLITRGNVSDLQKLPYNHMDGLLSLHLILL